MSSPNKATAPKLGGANSVTPDAPSISVAPKESDDADMSTEYETEATFDYDLPGELQNVALPDSDVGTLDTSSTPADIGKGLTPEESSFEGPSGDKPALASTPTGGVSLTETGVEAGAAAAGVTVAQNAGTVAGKASATGGAAQVTPTLNGLNPAANTTMAATEVPDVGTLEFGERGEAAGQEGGGEEAAEGGVELAAPNMPDLAYAGGGGEQLPNVPNQALPDYAASAGQTASAAVDAKASELDPVGPEADGKIASDVTPKLAEGQSAVDSAVANYEGQVAGFEADKQATSAEAAAKTASAVAEQAAAQAAANARQATESGEFAVSPVPAELENAASTIADISAGATANAANATAGEPLVELPGEAVANMDAAAADMEAFSNDYVAPDLAADFGATNLPDHGLDVEAFETLVDPAGFEFDESVLPASNTGGAGGGGMHAEVESAVMAKLEPAVADQQEAVRNDLASTGTEGLQSLEADTKALYDQGAAVADNAIAEWDSIDIASEVANFDAEAIAAADLANTQNTAHIGEMTNVLNDAQSTFDVDAKAGTEAFAAEIDAATNAHTTGIEGAGNTYDADILAADNTLRTGHDAALGEYQGVASGAIQGAQNTFDAEQQLANTSLGNHQNQIGEELAQLQAEATAKGAEANAQYQAEFEAQQNFAQSQKDSLLNSAQSEVTNLQAQGNAEIQAELSAGQSAAQAEIDSAVSQANQDVSQANQQASEKMADAQKEPSLLDRAVNWLKEQVNKALDWIKARFDEVKNAINSALEAAKNTALGLLESAKEAALGVLDRVRGAIQSAIARVSQAIQSVIEVVSTALQNAVQAVTDFVNSAISTITDSINGALESFRTAVNGLIDGFVNVVSLIDEDLGAKLDAAAQGFQDTFNGLVDGAQAQVDAAGQTLQAAVDAAGDELQSSIEAAETNLQDKVAAAEEALASTVDMAFDTATAAVEATFDTLETAVEGAFDAAQAAVTLAIDTAYGAIEAGARALEEVVTTGLQQLDKAAQWVNENIVEPFTEFLADAWEGLQRFWVDFWNSAFRDILLGVALTALAVAITVATGGAGAPLAVVILASAVGTGATAAAVYGVGELGAREANQNLTTNLDTVDMSADEIRALSPEQVADMAKDADVTWPGATYIDPATGQMLPDFTDPANAWYADSMGDITDNADGSLSYRNDAGELVTLERSEDGVILDPNGNPISPEMREALAQQIYDKDENGNFTGESFNDSLRGSAALAAEKGIEHAINGAVTAATMGTAPGAGLGTGALSTTGKVTLGQFARAQAVSSAINATAGVGTTVAAGTVGEMIEDERSIGDAFEAGTNYDDLGDVAIDWAGNFTSDFATGMIGGAGNRANTGSWHEGTSTVGTGRELLTNFGTEVASSATGATIDTVTGNLIDDDKAWNDGLGEAVLDAGHLTGAAGNVVGGQLVNAVDGVLPNSSKHEGEGWYDFATGAATGMANDVTGGVISGVLDTGVEAATDDKVDFDAATVWNNLTGEDGALSLESLATSAAGQVEDGITSHIKANGVWGSDGYDTRGMSEAEATATDAANYDDVRRNVVGQPPGDTPPDGYHFRRNADGDIIAIVRNRADGEKHAALTIDSNGNVAFGTKRNNSYDQAGETDLARRAAEEVVEPEVLSEQVPTAELVTPEVLSDVTPQNDGVEEEGAESGVVMGPEENPALAEAHLANEDLSYGSYFDTEAFVQGLGENGAISPSDVNQGQLGDCYLMASMAALAHSEPDTIREMIQPKDDGTFDVTLHFWNADRTELVPHVVNVDNQVPMDWTQSKPVYAQTGSTTESATEMWPALIEKAAAQMSGTYDAIDAGSDDFDSRVGSTFEMLTGRAGGDGESWPSWETQDPTGEKEYAYSYVQSMLASQTPVVVATRDMSSDQELTDRANAMGVYGNHAYTPIGLDPDSREVTLRNPWGDEHTITLDARTFGEFFQLVKIGTPDQGGAE